MVHRPSSQTPNQSLSRAAMNEIIDLACFLQGRLTVVITVLQSQYSTPQVTEQQAIDSLQDRTLTSDRLLTT